MLDLTQGWRTRGCTHMAARVAAHRKCAWGCTCRGARLVCWKPKGCCRQGLAPPLMHAAHQPCLLPPVTPPLPPQAQHSLCLCKRSTPYVRRSSGRPLLFPTWRAWVLLPNSRVKGLFYSACAHMGRMRRLGGGPYVQEGCDVHRGSTSVRPLLPFRGHGQAKALERWPWALFLPLSCVHTWP